MPPRFVERFTSSDEEVREDSSVSLRCRAKGSPEPDISWRREDGLPINAEKNSSDKGIGINIIPFGMIVSEMRFSFMKNAIVVEVIELMPTHEM